MATVATCLWFGTDGEAAARCYVALLPDSRIDRVLRAPGDWPGGVAGDALMIDFTLAGQRYQALNGGRPENYGNAASIAVEVDTQAEVDRLWAALTADGGQEIACGWLRDRFGVPWQIVPAILPRLLADPDPARAARAFAAMTRMVKIDAAAVEAAADGD